MRKIADIVAGLLRPSGTASNDPIPPRQPARMILGGPAAPELVMLPKDGTIETVDGHNLVQLKADGIAALYVDGRVVSARTGEPLNCALHCQPGLARLEAAYGHPMVIVGEYVAEDGFTATLAEHKRGQGDGAFWVYDALPHGAWVTGRDYQVSTLARLSNLRDVFNATDVGLFTGFLDYWVLSDDGVRAKFAEIVAAGFEGIVAKRLDAPFRRRRSDDWLRIKHVHTVDGPIVDMIGRADGTLKSMIVRTDDGPVVVPTGWSIEEGRTLLAAFRAGITVEPVWAEISFERSVGVKRAVRGARFHRIRMTKESIA